MEDFKLVDSSYMLGIGRLKVGRSTSWLNVYSLLKRARMGEKLGGANYEGNK